MSLYKMIFRVGRHVVVDVKHRKASAARTILVFANTTVAQVKAALKGDPPRFMVDQASFMQFEPTERGFRSAMRYAEDLKG